MKKTNFLYKSITLSLPVTLLMAQMMFSACKKDTLDSKDLLVYMDGDYGSVTNTVTVPFLHTPIGTSGDSLVQLTAYATRDVAADVQVSIAPDTSLVSGYNIANNTHCEALPASAYQIVNSGTHKIPSGGLSSDSMLVLITNPAALTDTNGYLLPLSISGITGKDKGVQISSTRRTSFVRITYKYTNIAASEAPLTGTLASRTGWSVTVSNTTSGSLGPAMLDGSNTTSWRSSNSSTAAKYVIMNMGSLLTMKGFQLTPDYVSTGDDPTQIRVSTSTDSLTWTAQGIWTGTVAAAGSNAANPVLKGIGFLAPVQAQYFRFDILAWVSGSRTGIGELNVMQ